MTNAVVADYETDDQRRWRMRLNEKLNFRALREVKEIILVNGDYIVLADGDHLDYNREEHSLTLRIGSGDINVPISYIYEFGFADEYRFDIKTHLFWAFPMIILFIIIFHWIF